MHCGDVPVPCSTSRMCPEAELHLARLFVGDENATYHLLAFQPVLLGTQFWKVLT